MKPKYKIGDRVRIVDKWNAGTNENPSGRMDHWLGKVMTIRFVSAHYYEMVEDQSENSGYGWYWNDDCIAGLEKEHAQRRSSSRRMKKIVITTDGETTQARYYEDRTLVHTAEAVCSPDDTFDFGTGAKLAAERLLEKMKPQPKFKEGDVVRITDNMDTSLRETPYHHLLVGGFAKVLDPGDRWVGVVGLDRCAELLPQSVLAEHLELVETK
jgi:hypothetical protein